MTAAVRSWRPLAALWALLVVVLLAAPAVGDMQRFATHAPRDSHIALAILEGAAQFWSERGVPFHVLVAADNEPVGSALPVVRPP